MKGSEDFNGNNIGLASLPVIACVARRLRIIVICAILQARMISADFLQTCNTTLMFSGHVSTIILMRGSDRKYREICFKSVSFLPSAVNVMLNLSSISINTRKKGTWFSFSCVFYAWAYVTCVMLVAQV